MRDLKNGLDVVQSLAPASRTAAVNGTGVDLQGFGSSMVVISAGAIGGTTPSFTFEVQDSDDNTTFAAVADADLDGVEPVLTAGGSVTRIGYRGSKRHVRVAITAASGTAPTLLCEAAVVRGLPSRTPV